MPFTIIPVIASDFPILLGHASSPLGDLAAPVLYSLWPAPSSPTDLSDGPVSPARTARLTFSITQQRLQFESDPTAHFIKAVDERTGDIAALGRWHFYPDGWDADDGTWREVDASDGPLKMDEVSGGRLGDEQKAGLMKKAYVEFLRGFSKVRARSWGKGTGPCWVLTTLITRPGYRRQGAAKGIVKWGMERAQADAVPARIEGGPKGSPVYASMGFEAVEHFELPMKQFGLESDSKLTSFILQPKKKGEV